MAPRQHTPENEMTSRIAAILLVTMTTSVAAQWLHHRDPTIPRMKGGQPNMVAPAPRAANGKPDLSGVWAADPSDELKKRGDADPLAADLQFISKYALNILADFKPGEEPIRPEAAALLRQRMENSGKDSPTSHCLPGGVPFSTLIAPFKIVQTPRAIVLLLEDNNPPRQIHTDGRKHPTDSVPSWMGYSVGTWQDDVLVADTIGFNDRSWLDAMGHPRSEAMHIVERFRRRDFGHMDVAITIDDAKLYTTRFTAKITYRLLPDTDIMEAVCAENEKDRVHLDR
jgi:hypothetical protein